MRPDEILCIFGLLKLRGGTLKYDKANIKISGWKKLLLELVFLILKYPSTNTREVLGQMTGYSARKIQTWIQNRRTGKEVIHTNDLMLMMVNKWKEKLSDEERAYGEISYELLIKIYFFSVKHCNNNQHTKKIYGFKLKNEFDLHM